MRGSAAATVLALALSLVACRPAYEPTAIQRDLLRVPRDAESRHDFASARTEYRRLAQAGIVDAQISLARMLQDGRGGPEDREEAVAWYLAAANAGSPVAMREVGRAYRSGDGLSRDIPNAARWFGRAAEKGDEPARFELATLALSERSGSEEEAIAALEASANSGYLPAQIELAERYDKGDALPRDPGAARRWYSIVAATLEQEARNGDQGARNRLADMYRDGKGVPQDGERAARMYGELVEAGRDMAIVDLARLYRDGAGNLKPDPVKSARYFAEAADRGHAASAYDLGKIYYRGEGVPKDMRRAITRFEQALRLGDDRALLYLGDIYSDKSELQDFDDAAAYYRRSGLAGNPKGYFRLAELHERGRLRSSDPALALALYELSAEGGYDRGQERADRVRGRLSANEQARARALKGDLQRASLGR
ncbi:MAG: SEL1-like repeat protein [Geminicoccaceae bacterium]|nr:SEL1-like repeat protein [Geminicoccaceae bacterium]